MMDFYFVRRRTGLSAEEARDAAQQRMPAVARPFDKADWYVAFLHPEKQEDGQEPYRLDEAERAELERWMETRKYVNLIHFAAERKAEIEQHMDNLLDLLNDSIAPRGREDYKRLLDAKAVQWAAWHLLRTSI